MTETKEAFADGNARGLNDLAIAAAAGNEESFSRLVKVFYPPIRAMVASLSVPESERDDLMQEGLIGLYKAVRLFDSKLSSFATFARLCIRSAILDSLKRYRRLNEEECTELEDSIAASPSQTPERIFMGKEALRELLQKMDHALSPSEKQIFALHLQGKSVPEMAKQLGKDKKSVENTLYRARKKLS